MTEFREEVELFWPQVGMLSLRDLEEVIGGLVDDLLAENGIALRGVVTSSAVKY